MQGAIDQMSTYHVPQMDDIVDCELLRVVVYIDVVCKHIIYYAGLPSNRSHGAEVESEPLYDTASASHHNHNRGFG